MYYYEYIYYHEKTICKSSTLSPLLLCYNINSKIPLREKCPNTEFFLVRIFPHSDGIRTGISPYSVRIRENTDRKKLGIWTLFKQWYVANNWTHSNFQHTDKFLIYTRTFTQAKSSSLYNFINLIP